MCCMGVDLLAVDAFGHAGYDKIAAQLCGNLDLHAMTPTIITPIRGNHLLTLTYPTRRESLHGVSRTANEICKQPELSLLSCERHKSSNARRSAQQISTNQPYVHIHCLSTLLLPTLAPPRLPRALHLPISAPLDSSIISLQHAALALVCRTKRIAPLLAHALHLPNLPDGLLELLHARPVVLDVVLLDLLHVVVRLGLVHALSIFPRDVAHQTQPRDHQCHAVEDRRLEGPWDDACVFVREAAGDQRRHGAVDGNEDEPERHAAWDGEEGPFGPNIGYERGFAQDRGENGGVEGGSPDPMAGCFAVALGEVPGEDEFGEYIGY